MREQYAKTPFFDPKCRLCPRLAKFRDEARREHPDYFNAPVPQFGDWNARFIIVGLAPGFHGANATGRPFTGDYAGELLYRTLHAFGFASAPESISASDDLKLLDCRITNSVKCVPPANKPLPDEIKRCNRYLAPELQTLPPGVVLLALGAIAHKAALMALNLPQSKYPFAHGNEHRLPNGMTLLDSYHCSRYNTQTRRLTEEMFRAVVGRVRDLIDRDA